MDSMTGEEMCRKYLPNKVIYRRVIKNITDALIMKIRGKKRKNKPRKRKTFNRKNE